MKRIATHATRTLSRMCHSVATSMDKHDVAIGRIVNSIRDLFVLVVCAIGFIIVMGTAHAVSRMVNG